MKHLNILPGMLLCALLLTAGANAQKTATLADAKAALEKQPLAFIENRGQWHPDAQFLARMNGLDLWVTDKALVYDLYQMDTEATPNTAVRSGHVVRMEFLGAGKSASAAGYEALPGTYNYFIGKDRTRWATNVKRFGEARIQSLYPGVDAVLYADNGAPRYDLVVAPGADPSAIRIAYKGAKGVRIDQDGELVISTSRGEVKQHGLFAYQMVKGEQRAIPCSFKLDHAGTVGFQVGAYDRKVPLVIDPIIYSTFYGGSNWDEARAVVADTSQPNMRMYAAGFTYSTNFPMNSGSYQTTYAGDAGGAPPGGDAFVTKLDPLQSPPAQIVWATYIGSDGNDAATDMVVDNTGSVYITGVSGTEFPTTHTVVSVASRGVFVTKLNQFGIAITWSTYVADGSVSSVAKMAMDASGRIYVAGGTNASTLPTTAGAFRATLSGPSDAFVSVLEANGQSLAYATYLGGTGDDMATGIALSSFGEIHLCGSTTSNNFPLRRNFAFDSTYNGGTDVFLARLSRTHTGDEQLLSASYYGGAGYDAATDVVIDSFGDMIAVGTTTSTDFPVRNAVQSTYRGSSNATVGDAFVLKVNPVGAPAVQILYSTYLGGAAADIATNLVGDRAGNVYITGWTGSASFPITNNALDTMFGGDSSDAFVTKLHSSGAMTYSTFLGGTAGDKGYAITLTRQAGILVAGHTRSTNFPVSALPFQGTLNSATNPDAFLTHFNILEVTSPRGGELLCAGTEHQITWSGSATASYNIYISSDSGETYNPLAFNVTGNSYPWLIPQTFPTGKMYRVKVALATGFEYDISDSNATVNSKPFVTRNPQNVIQVEGGTANFTVDATGVPTPTVQWQFNTGGGWTTIQGETQRTLTISNITAAQKGTQYRAIFINGCGADTTDLATLDVAAILVTSPNGGESWCAGTTQTITWTAQSTAGPFDIFVSDNAGVNYDVLASGVSGTSYSWAIPANMFGTNFRIQVRIANAQAMDASDANFTILSPGVVVRNPANASAAQGTSASFVAEGNGYPFPTVMWEVNTGGTWAPVEGITTPVLVLQNVQMAQNGSRYRAIFTNLCGADTTTEATLTVTPPAGVDMEAGARALSLAVAPNPLVGDGSIRFTLPRAARVSLTIIDLQGNVVARPLDAMLKAGDHAVPFDADALPNGTYMVGITAGAEHGMLKVTIAR